MEDWCNLCEKKYSKLYKPDDRLLDRTLSSVINFIIGDDVEFPPKYLICTECSATLIQTEFFLQRLSKSLPSTINFTNSRLNSASSHNEQDESNDVEREDQRKEKANEQVDSAKKEDVSKAIDSIVGWTFYCTHCEFRTKRPKLYKRHLLTKHQVNNPRIYQCMYCKDTYQRINAIQNHIACVHENKPRPTRQRRKTINSDTPSLLSSTTIKSQLDNETSVVNTKIENNAADKLNALHEFDCTQCKYKTVHSKIYKKHMKSKHNIKDSRIYKCKRCPSTYARQFHLQNHVAYEHENKPKPKLQRRKSVPATGLESNTTGDKEDLQVIKLQQENLEDAEEHGEQVVNYESDTVYQDENRSHDSQVYVAGTTQIHVWPRTATPASFPKSSGEFEGGYNNNNQDENTSINSIADEQQNQEENVFQTTTKRKRNHLSSSEMSTTEWIYQCAYCNFEGGNRKKYKLHMIIQHGVNDSDIYT